MKDSEILIGPLRKYAMWYEVQKLRERGLNKSQISKELGMDRGTVRHYLRMSESEFLKSESYKRQYDLKLERYETFVVGQLKEFPYLSASQIEDKLKEQYGRNLGVCSKTIFNFVTRMRDKYGLPKRPEDNPRPYEMQPELPYGEWAQSDFGERYMSRESGSCVKVYFFVMILSRSRYKFVYMSLQPFTTATTIYAHELAFAYFGGMPKKILYDQDKVLIKDENLGEILLTEGFRTFVSEQHFESVFCRKSDPESKGKVENAVGYVKHNFLSGRKFKDIDALNSEALEWLERTGNGAMHHGTHRIPADVFEEEKKNLLPYYGTPTPPKVEMEERIVRKDNVVNFHCCYYTVPTGTYQGPSSTVHIEEKNGFLHIYSKETGKIIAEHPVSKEKGKLIRNTSHLRDRTSTYAELEDKIRTYLGESDALDTYLAGIYSDKRRYYRDNLCYIVRNMNEIAPQTLLEALARCMSSNTYHAPMWIETARTIQKKKGEKPMEQAVQSEIKINYNNIDMTPIKSDINSYKALFNGK